MTEYNKKHQIVEESYSFYNFFVLILAIKNEFLVVPAKKYRDA